MGEWGASRPPRAPKPIELPVNRRNEMACSAMRNSLLVWIACWSSLDGCSAGGTNASGAIVDDAGNPVIEVGEGGNAFVPADLSVPAGTTVAWVWMSDGHSVTSGNPETCTPDHRFDTGIQATGYRFTVLFGIPGTYGYYCTEHCPGMGGTIVVQ